MGKQPGTELLSPPPKYKPFGCVFAGLGWQPPHKLFHARLNPDSISLAKKCPVPTSPNIKREENHTSKETGLPIRIKTEDEILQTALGAPARRVLQRAEALGPKTGWKDGHLSTAYGFCPPDPSSSPTALSISPGTQHPRYN